MLIGIQKNRLSFMTPEFFGKRRFYTVCCVHKMEVSVAGSAAKRVGQTVHTG